jgi:hypothetical protein
MTQPGCGAASRLSQMHVMEEQIIAIKSLFGELFAKLITFSLDPEFDELLADSLCVYYRLEEGEEYEFIPEDEFLFLSWFLFDDTDAQGKSLSDTFLERHADSLTLQETQVCKALGETCLSLMQVVEVVPNESMLLRDVFLGEQIRVWESLGSEGIAKGSLLFSRVLSLGNQKFLVGAGIFLEGTLEEALSRFVTEHYRRFCEENEPMTFKEFLKQNGEIIQWWIRAYQNGKTLELVPSDKK